MARQGPSAVPKGGNGTGVQLIKLPQQARSRVLLAEATLRPPPFRFHAPPIGIRPSRRVRVAANGGRPRRRGARRGVPATKPRAGRRGLDAACSPRVCQRGRARRRALSSYAGLRSVRRPVRPRRGGRSGRGWSLLCPRPSRKGRSRVCGQSGIDCPIEGRMPPTAGAFPATLRSRGLCQAWGVSQPGGGAVGRSSGSHLPVGRAGPEASGMEHDTTGHTAP